MTSKKGEEFVITVGTSDEGVSGCCVVHIEEETEVSEFGEGTVEEEGLTEC